MNDPSFQLFSAILEVYRIQNTQGRNIQNALQKVKKVIDDADSENSILYKRVNVSSYNIRLEIVEIEVFEELSEPSLPIHWISSLGILPLMKMFIEIDPNLATIGYGKYQRRSLHLSCKFDHKPVTEFLLSMHPDSISSKDKYYRLPIHYAAANSCTEVLSLLIERYPSGASAKDRDDRLPLHLSCRDGHFNCCEMLLNAYPEAASQKDNKDNLPLHQAALIGHQSLCRHLLEIYPQAATVGDRNETLPIHLAVRLGHLEAAEVLLSFNPSTLSVYDSNIRLPLHYGNSLPMVRLMMNTSFEHNIFGIDRIGGLFETSTDRFGRSIDNRPRLASLTTCSVWDIIERNHGMKKMAELFHQVARDTPILHAAIGYTSLKSLKSMVQIFPIDLSKRDSKGRIALCVAIDRAVTSHRPLDWESYYRTALQITLGLCVLKENDSLDGFEEVSSSEEADDALQVRTNQLESFMDDNQESTEALQTTSAHDRTDDNSSGGNIPASIMDGNGQLPLHYAIEKGLPIDGIMDIVDSYPDGLTIQEGKTGLYAFMLAAIMLSDLDLIFQLMSYKPDLFLIL